MLEIGKIYDDLKCVRKVYMLEILKRDYSNYYLMQCTKCGRTKVMRDHTVFRKSGTCHSACGKGIHLLDPIFYERWQAMRTRTTNPNYHAYDRYGGRGINSDEFEYFIDFYDKMYSSWLEACKLIGDPHNVSLERIDVNKSYTSDNCKWIHKNDQPKNTCKTIKFFANHPDHPITYVCVEI